MVVLYNKDDNGLEMPPKTSKHNNMDLLLHKMLRVAKVLKILNFYADLIG